MSGARQPGRKSVSISSDTLDVKSGEMFLFTLWLCAFVSKQKHRPVATEAHYAANSTAVAGETMCLYCFLLFCLCATVTPLWMMHISPALSVDNLRSPLQKLSDGSVSLHEQRRGVAERPVPHYGQWFCKFSRSLCLPLNLECVSSACPRSCPSFSIPQFILHECKLRAGSTSTQ